jgi:hypothetical protein
MPGVLRVAGTSMLLATRVRGFSSIEISLLFGFGGNMEMRGYNYLFRRVQASSPCRLRIPPIDDAHADWSFDRCAAPSLAAWAALTTRMSCSTKGRACLVRQRSALRPGRGGTPTGGWQGFVWGRRAGFPARHAHALRLELAHRLEGPKHVCSLPVLGGIRLLGPQFGVPPAFVALSILL